MYPFHSIISSTIPSQPGVSIMAFSIWKCISLSLVITTARMGRAEDHVVTLGQYGNVFFPSEVTAAVGDVVIFVFYSGVLSQ